MKRIVYALAAVALLTAGCAQKSDVEKVVVAYVTSWTEVMPDPGRVTHVNYAFGHVTDSFDGGGH